MSYVLDFFFVGLKIMQPGLVQVTAEDMEAYRMKKVHHDDPMKDFLN